MLYDCCPVPTKRIRTQDSPEQSDSEDLKLSKTFDEDYRLLMNEEILKICRQPINFDDDFDITEVITNFHSGCDDLLKWTEKTLDKPRPKSQCRSDVNLVKFEKALTIERLFESPRFTNIQVLAKLITSNEPKLETDIQRKLNDLQGIWNRQSLQLDINVPLIVKDIQSDIDDLNSWKSQVDEILCQQIDDHRNMEYAEFVENILNDFKVHDDIINSIAKMIEKITQLDSVLIHSGALMDCKDKLQHLMSLVHEQWLRAMELKLKMESPSDMTSECTRRRSSGIYMGQESGFESEISPRNAARGLPTRNFCVMKNISSSGECMFDDNTSDFPMDSESSSTLSVDFHTNQRRHNDSHSSSTSLVGEMLDLPRQIIKTDLYVRKRQKRLKKRRHQHFRTSDISNDFYLSSEEKEKYLQIHNAFFKQSSHCLKRRISETSIPESLDRTEEAQNRILDLAAAAEKFVMKNDLNHSTHSISESPKESELEDEDNLIICSANELNVRDVWDNYQASLYSNDDGDSQIVEVDNIRDWDQEAETDDLDREATVQILTSGYETSMEYDNHLCNKNLKSVLQFSAIQRADANECLNGISKQLDTTTIVDDSINTIINEQLSIANTHIKLLDQIINNDPCIGTPHEPVVDQVRSLQREWDHLVSKFLSIQSQCGKILSYNSLDQMVEDVNRIKDEIAAIYTFTDLDAIIDFLREKKSELSTIDRKISRLPSSESVINGINEAQIKPRQKDLNILTSCLKKMIECQKQRKYVESKLKCLSELMHRDDWNAISQELIAILTESRSILDSCQSDLSSLSPDLCQEKLTYYLDEERAQLDKLHIQCALGLPIMGDLRLKTQRQSMLRACIETLTGFLGRMPVQLAVLVIIAMFGLWLKNQSSDRCNGSSQWFKVLRKYSDNLEPH